MHSNLGQFFGLTFLLLLFLLNAFIVQHSQELSKGKHDIFSHILPGLSRERDFLPHGSRVIAANTGFNCVAVRNILKK